MRLNRGRTAVVTERLITEAKWALVEFDHTTAIRYSSPLAVRLLGTDGPAGMNGSALADPVRRAISSHGGLVHSRIQNSAGQELDVLAECVRFGRAR